MSDNLTPTQKLEQSFSDKDAAKKEAADAAAFRERFENDVQIRKLAIDREQYEKSVEAEVKRRMKIE